jgi:hypothetical protein
LSFNLQVVPHSIGLFVGQEMLYSRPEYALFHKFVTGKKEGPWPVVLPV